MKSILCILWMLSPPASARLGETLAQCVSRYGIPNATGTVESVCFFKNDCKITIRFSEGVATFVQIYKLSFPVEFKDQEILATLAANGEGWQMMDNNKIVKIWETPGHSQGAVYQKNSATLTMIKFVKPEGGLLSKNSLLKP